jgi:DNA invertase Pin-like site-specific DNA recombinase
MYLNNFDSYKTYTEFVENELTDMSERTELNRMIYDAEKGLIDAVFVSDIRIFSPISVKALQAIISLQELGMNVYNTNGYIKADEKNIKLFKMQFDENWERINDISKGIDFGG